MEMTIWILFFALVPILLFVDLRLFNKGEDGVIDFKHSLYLSAFYIAAGLAFGALVWHNFGADRAMDYYTAYLLEKSLSLDNLFVMSVIFTAFAIPRRYQHRVLVWGIIGVVVLRGIMITAGAALIHNFEWVLYLFALLLMYTGAKMAFMEEEDDLDHFEKKPLVVFLKKHLPFTTEIDGHKFFIRHEKELEDGTKTRCMMATPLFLALVTIELSDLLFAVDSIPAALSVTTDVFVVFTSNIFAVLGLRALFFAVENIISRFGMMKYALCAVLVFIGGKVFYSGFIGHVAPAISLSITVGLLSAGIIASLIYSKKHPDTQN